LTVPKQRRGNAGEADHNLGFTDSQPPHVSPVTRGGKAKGKKLPSTNEVVERGGTGGDIGTLCEV